MAFSSTIFILFSLAAASTIAHSLVLPNTIVQVTILGRVVCTLTGNPVSVILDEPVAGANVTLSCNGGETSLGQALTDINGFYQVVLTTTDGLLFDESDCAVFIQLPVGNCTLLPTTGTLRAPVTTLLNIVLGDGGSLALLGTGLFELLGGSA